MSRILFNLAAKTDAAGRPSSPNQDNCWVCPDLTKWNEPVDSIVGTDEDVELSEKGALLVVADGMGGMNAGEVASALVIEGIKKKFSNIPDSILTSEDAIQNFIKDAIVESDESIKKYAKAHREAEGLGSTIVLLWLLNGRAFCGWCGDSRIYRFNPNNELVRLSHDHSYVQSLVDEGKITEEEAFDHPDGNVISKALGDNGTKADPELRVYDIYQRDVFLLCSDGLCGLLQDSEINDIIQDTCTSSRDTLNALWQKGEKTGWSDNATIDLLCIVDGGKPAKGRPDGYPKIVKKPAIKKGQNKPQIVSGGSGFSSKLFKPLLVIVALSLLGLALYKTLGSKEEKESSNHEYNIDVPEATDENDAEDDSGTGASNANQNAGNQGGRNNTNNNTNASGGHQQPGRQTGTPNNAGNNGQNQNGNTGNNGQNQNDNAGNNGNQTPVTTINIGQLPNYVDDNAQTNQQNPPQPAENYPSQDYLKLLNRVYNDYVKAKNTFSFVTYNNFRTPATDEDIKHYLSNIDNNIFSLKNDQKNYNALSQEKKNDIMEFSRLAEAIRRNYGKYELRQPINPDRRQDTRPNRRQENENTHYDDVYGRGL